MIIKFIYESNSLIKYLQEYKSEHRIKWGEELKNYQ